MNFLGTLGPLVSALYDTNSHTYSNEIPSLSAITDTSGFATTHVVVSVRHPITY